MSRVEIFSQEDSGGFCGAFSVQHAALAFGAWISQDLVRKANREQPGPHNMHGNTTVGFEVMPSNAAYTAAHLRLSYEEWDSAQPAPQSAAYKAWLKRQLAAGNPVAWFPICKGDDHQCYPGARVPRLCRRLIDVATPACPLCADSCPNGGECDHVEPVYGIFSNHPLSDPVVYADDYILHASDQDLQTYYRPIESLNDSLAMTGNCLHAQPGYGRNEMYPCFDTDVTYGLAVTGLATAGPILPVALITPGAVSEPNIRDGAPAVNLTGTVIVGGLSAGARGVLYRYNGTDALPAGPPYSVGAAYSTPFTAAGSTWTFADPVPFLSSSATYYVAVRLA